MPETALRPVNGDWWEPAKPSMAVAQQAYQTLLELHRAHPEDADLLQSLHHADEMLKTIWQEQQDERRSRL